MKALISVVVVLVITVDAQAENLVTIGDLGNAPDTRYATRGYGGVDYTYSIDKFEVTNVQYAEFLNAVADSDPNTLYNTGMGSGVGGITRSVSSPYSYETIAGRGEMPVSFVSWYDTLRYANWLQNGKPIGAQGPGTTEDGTYAFSGPTSVTLPVHSAFTTPHWVLPSENEWYKAAYYKGGGTSAGYWDFPTKNDDAPTAAPPPGGSNSANYDGAVGDLTIVGSYTASDSAYGTFDQAGNVWEWAEDMFDADFRVLRGGSYVDFGIGGVEHSHASIRGGSFPSSEDDSWGFRVARVPEPTALSLLAFGGLLLARRRPVAVPLRRLPIGSTWWSKSLK